MRIKIWATPPCHARLECAPTDGKHTAEYLERTERTIGHKWACAGSPRGSHLILLMASPADPVATYLQTLIFSVYVMEIVLLLGATQQSKSLSESF